MNQHLINLFEAVMNENIPDKLLKAYKVAGHDSSTYAARGAQTRPNVPMNDLGTIYNPAARRNVKGNYGHAHYEQLSADQALEYLGGTRVGGDSGLENFAAQRSVFLPRLQNLRLVFDHVRSGEAPGLVTFEERNNGPYAVYFCDIPRDYFDHVAEDRFGHEYPANRFFKSQSGETTNAQWAKGRAPDMIRLIRMADTIYKVEDEYDPQQRYDSKGRVTGPKEPNIERTAIRNVLRLRGKNQQGHDSHYPDQNYGRTGYVDDQDPIRSFFDHPEHPEWHSESEVPLNYRTPVSRGVVFNPDTGSHSTNNYYPGTNTTRRDMRYKSREIGELSKYLKHLEKQFEANPDKDIMIEIGKVRATIKDKEQTLSQLKHSVATSHLDDDRTFTKRVLEFQENIARYVQATSAANRRLYDLENQLKKLIPDSTSYNNTSNQYKEIQNNIDYLHDALETLLKDAAEGEAAAKKALAIEDVEEKLGLALQARASIDTAEANRCIEQIDALLAKINDAKAAYDATRPHETARAAARAAKNNKKGLDPDLANIVAFKDYN